MRADVRAPAISVLVQQDPDGVPLYTQLYRQLREHILNGTLAPGASLPSARTLASDLHLSRNTVESAINQLRAEGYVTRRVGAGTLVADTNEVVPFAHRRRTTHNESNGRPVPRAAPTLSSRGALLAEGGRAEIDSDRQTGPCSVDVVRFPARTWQRILAREARRGASALLNSGDPQGNRALRAAISEHARLTRGLACSAEQVVIVSSTQQALDLASRLLLTPGDTALVEDPGYPAARAVFASAGAVVHGIPVDDRGVQVDAFRRHPKARLLYLTPSHQYPLGVTLTLARRVAALAWANETGAWIIEDDYDSEFHYNGRPIAAMQGLDRNERVLYVGTFNKVLFPGIRLAYLILPTALVDPFVSARRLSDGGSPSLPQAALAEFMSAGHFAAHLRRAGRLYRQRRDLLVDCLEKAGLTIGPNETGIHLTVHLPQSVDDVALSAATAGHGLGVSPLSRYYLGPSAERGLLLSFGAATESEIRSDVAAIVALL